MTQIDFEDLQWDQDQCAVTDAGPYTGEVVERDSAGNVVAVITYRDGFKDGKEIHYFPDGRLAFEGEWRWGAGGVGEHRVWYPSGQLKEVAHYNDKGYLERVDRFGEDGTPVPSPDAAAADDRGRLPRKNAG